VKNTKRAVEWSRAKPKLRKDVYFFHQYGIDIEGRGALLSFQEGQCANPGCHTKEPGTKAGFHTDHDHASKRVRGELCHHCNHALQDGTTPAKLRGAADYSESFNVVASLGFENATDERLVEAARKMKEQKIAEAATYDPLAALLKARQVCRITAESRQRYLREHGRKGWLKRNKLDLSK
jgi:hypothetical protein